MQRCGASYIVLNPALMSFCTDLRFRKTYLVERRFGHQKFLNLYLSAVNISTAFFNAVNSEPKVDDSTEFYLFLNQSIAARLQNISIPVYEQLVTLSVAWLASMKQCVVMILLLGFGISSVNASLEPRLKSSR